MKLLEDKYIKQIKKENLLVTFLLLFKSTQASVLAFSPITTIIFLLYLLYLFNQRNLKIDKYFVHFTIIYFLILFIYLFDFGEIDFFLSVYIYIKFLYAFLSVKIISTSFFENFQKIVYYGALISIPLFIIQIFAYDLLFEIIGFFQNNISFLSFRNDRFANIFFFTIEGYGAQARNSGFMWEPKGYANVLILAIIFNLIQSKVNFFNKRILVYSLALITTFSTTGYVIFFCLLPLFVIYNKKSNAMVFNSILLIIGAYFILQLDFMIDKIKYESTLTDEYKVLLSTTRDYDSNSISLGRVGSLIVDFNDFKKKPIFGYGFQKEERTQNKWIKLVRVNGFSDLMATYGLVGLVFYFIMYKRLYKKLLSYYNLKGINILLISTFVIYFASTLTAHPLWMSFLFIHLTIPNNENTSNSISRS